MIQIPTQLKNYNFIFLNHDIKDKSDIGAQKRPVQKDWPYTNNYSFTSKEFTRYSYSAKRYGVLCGLHNLIVIDFDNAEVQEKILPKLPPTFAVTTAAKGLLHLYFETDVPESWKCFDEKGNTLFDVQGFSKFVVGPNSILEDGRKYEVFADLPISFITHQTLKEIFKDYIIIGASKSALEKGNKLFKETDIFIDPEVQQIKSLLPIHIALKEWGIDITKNPTLCPLGHSSIHQASFSYEFDEEKLLWKCFNCQKAGDIITLYEERFGWDFVKTKNELIKKLNIRPENLGMRNVDLTTNDRIDDKEYDLNMLILRDSVIEKKQFTPQFYTQAALLLNKRYIFITRDENDDVFFYNDKRGVFESAAEIRIKLELEKYFGHYVSQHVTNEVLGHIRRKTYKDFKTLNYHSSNFLCLKNGVYDISTQELLPHDPKYYFMSSIPIKYDPQSTCPLVDKFFSEIVNKNDIELLYEVFAFALLPHYRIQKAVLLVGMGSNGKSVYLNLLRKFLGSENVSGQSLQNLTNEGFSIFELYNKYSNICADLSAKEISDTGKFKSLTSEDLQDANQKFKRSFKFENIAKLIFSCNNTPASRDQDDAFFRRWLLIIFPNKFEGLRADGDLIDKVSSEDELSGLFNKVLIKYKLLDDLKCFSRPDDIAWIRDTYNRLANTAAPFLDDEVEISPMDYIPKRELYDKYIQYCSHHGLPPLSSSAFFNRVKERLNVSSFYAHDATTNTRIPALRGIMWNSGENKIIEEEHEMNLGEFYGGKEK